VTVRLPAAAPSSQTVNDTVPFAVAPVAGSVMTTLTVPPADGLIVKVSVLEVWPSALRTVTDAEPAAATSEAGMLAVTRVALTSVVVRTAPFHCTVAPAGKLVPSAVGGHAAAPAG